MNVRVGSATDIGQVREGNEDSFLLLAPLYAVADGMGGHRGGEVASSLALETVQRLFERQEGTLAQQVTEANRAVFERSQQDRSVAGMGTTLTAALVEGDRVHLAHVGDSRAYLFRDGELTMLTEDHTLVHRMVMEGEITEAEAETHPHRSILTRALGVDMNVQVDEHDVQVADGDRLLLCSDGLTGMVSDDRIREILASAPDPQEAVDALVRVANRAGGVDNITAVLLDFAGEPERSDTGNASVPHQPTVERPMPQAEPPRRSDITVVGAPIPEPPPRAAGRSPARTPSTSSAEATSRRAPARPTPRPEPARPSPRRGGAARRWGVGAGLTLTVAVLAIVGLRLYLDSQWFVGVSNGRVAIYRGVPAEVAGVGLHSVVVESGVLAEDAQALPLYRDLGDGITAADRDAAEAIVEQIRDDVASAEPAGP
ncbi:MAG TPA: Stp1/IreP family PP2C-type Ser/Thr phosphatase [Actinomycetota bacterium]|nr:Stp1/IreP family PP2C-type Ser/Thr phosphatase [Actinomycetota bacterium]